jgi:hypothetical protein
MDEAAFVLTAYELRGPGNRVVRIFRQQDDARAAIEHGDHKTVEPVQMVTVDGGRTGWRIEDAWPIWRDVHRYLRERALAKLSVPERDALSMAVGQAPTGAEQARAVPGIPSAGLITVHGASYQHVDGHGRAETPAKLSALFYTEADALRAALDLSNGAGHDGITRAIRAVTLDGGLSCHMIGDEPPWRIWELTAYLAERARAKLTAEESAALGLAPEPTYPAIVTAYEAVAVHVQPSFGGCQIQNLKGVGVFVRASDAQQAARGLSNEPGRDGQTRPVRVMTLDGRSGFRVPLAHDGTEAPPVTVWHSLDAYLRERARARLTAGEQLAALPAVEPVTGGAPQASPFVGVVELWEAVQTADAAPDVVVGNFVNEADAECAVKGLHGSGRVRESAGFTLDGRSAWLLGPPETLWHDVEAHLRDRAMAKLDDDERRAWGLESRDQMRRVG